MGVEKRERERRRRNSNERARFCPLATGTLIKDNSCNGVISGRSGRKRGRTVSRSSWARLLISIWKSALYALSLFHSCDRFVGDSSSIRAPSLSWLRRIRVSLSSSGDGTRVNSKGGQNSEGDFRRREGAEPPARRKGVARGSIRKYQTGNCSADCLSACGYFRADSWWRMGFLFLFFFFLISQERIVEFFSELNWEQIGDGDGENF